MQLIFNDFCKMNLEQFIIQSLAEDTGNGDHSSLSSIAPGETGNAILKIKDNGIIAGIDLAQLIFKTVDPKIIFSKNKSDGNDVSSDEIAFSVDGHIHTILKCERLVLNCMQRMSGIATLTAKYVNKISGTQAKILDTRKTTPLFRHFEKWAVRIGGGGNHRMGLYDMILLKDNHIDYAGGIKNAIKKANEYVKKNKLNLEIEVETRNIHEVNEVIECGNVNRIMLDNFTTAELEHAIKIINGKFETEASGGIGLENVIEYAKTGVNYISVGNLTHSYKSFDLSLKAV